MYRRTRGMRWHTALSRRAAIMSALYSTSQQQGRDVVALVSGGKDSAFTILECLREGHRIVAIANLRSSLPENCAEVDSHMFQTVGMEIVPAYAECMGNLPFFQCTLVGGSVNTKMTYQHSVASGDQQDEVEDLERLLVRVKRCIPSVSAVCTGAILSDYQRLRVEYICGRIGLLSMAPLWRRDQKALLASMVDSKLEAVIAKVAVIGLSPSKHLGKTLGQMQAHLHVLEAKYGCNVCGEGGEFETLTLDTPYFAKRIVLDDYSVVSHDDDLFAPVAYLHVRSFHLEDKLPADVPFPPPEVERRGLVLREDAKGVLPPSAGEDVSNDGSLHCCSHTESPVDTSDVEVALELLESDASGCKAPTRLKQCTLSIVRHDAVDLDDEERASRQMHAMMQALERHLRATVTESASTDGGSDDTLSSVYAVRLFVRDMQLFGAINRAYSHYFTSDPPSRCCVQVAPETFRCSESLIHFECLVSVAAANEAADDNDDAETYRRKTMHVQSLSFWAPACIGQYSQATCASSALLWMAGQIPLHPFSMNLLPPLEHTGDANGAQRHVLTVLRNLDAVLEPWTRCLRDHSRLYVSYVSAPDLIDTYAKEMESALRYVHATSDSDDDDDDDDDGETRASRTAVFWPTCVDEERVHGFLQPLLSRIDEWKATTETLCTTTPCRPPVLWVSVPTLPKSATIEIQPLIGAPSNSANVIDPIRWTEANGHRQLVSTDGTASVVVTIGDLCAAESLDISDEYGRFVSRQVFVAKEHWSDQCTAGAVCADALMLQTWDDDAAVPVACAVVDVYERSTR